MLKNRVKKIEDRQPKPQPANIKYIAVFGHEADPNDKDFIAEWRQDDEPIKKQN